MALMVAKLFVLLLACLLHFRTSAAANIIDPNSFKETVLNSADVWAVEFFSGKCGSCLEFAPTWDKLEVSLKSLKTGKVDIDDKVGEKVAGEVGVLDEGIPGIRVFTKNGDSVGSSILIETPESPSEYKKVMKAMKKLVVGLKKGESGLFQKS